MDKYDMELLQLAGRAANIPPRVIGATGSMYWVEETKTVHQAWNPLQNDGDAFRLAVQFHLQLSCGSHLNRSWAQRGPVEYYSDWDQYGGDKDKALRYAIVLAVAELGATM